MTLPLIGAADRGFFANVWHLIKPYWSSEEKVDRPRICCAVVIVLNLGQVYLNVKFNDWYGRFYDALQQKQLSQFWHELLVFAILSRVLHRRGRL